MNVQELTGKPYVVAERHSAMVTDVLRFCWTNGGVEILLTTGCADLQQVNMYNTNALF